MTNQGFIEHLIIRPFNVVRLEKWNMNQTFYQYVNI